MTGLERAILDAASEGAPDTIALMRILMEAESESEAREAIAAAKHRWTEGSDARGAAALDRISTLWASIPGAWAAVRGTVSAIAHRQSGRSPEDVLTYWAESFDRLVAAQPEASVALYSLGSPELLAAATDEIVERMSDWGLIPPDATVLDLGCGIGRFLEALAPRVARVIGLDISLGMVAEAARRCAGLSNVTVGQSSGRDLTGIADHSLDLILAADVFPYLVEAGGTLVDVHVAEAARVLRPGGALLILNYSYGGDLAADCDAVASRGARFGFAVECLGTGDFTRWDGKTFLLRRSSGG